MTTVKEARRARLQELVDGCGGGQAEVARRLNKDRRQVSAWLADPRKKGAKGVSEKVAREIEGAFGKPRGWMDSLTDSATLAVNEPAAMYGHTSQSVQWDSESLTEAERWVRFEEGAGIVFSEAERAKRFAALYDAILADGGRLSPEHCEALIDNARRRLGGSDGNGKGGGGRKR